MKANLPALLELIRERRATQVDYRSGTSEGRSKWERRDSKAANRPLENSDMLQKAVELVRKHIACLNTTGNDNVTTRGKLKETLMAITELASKHEYIRKLSGGGQGTKQLVKYLLRDKIKDVMIQGLDGSLPDVESTIECKVVRDNNGNDFVQMLDTDQETWWIDEIKKYLPIADAYDPGFFSFDRPSAADAFPVGMLEYPPRTDDDQTPIFLPLDVLGAQSKFESIIGDKIYILPCELLPNGLQFRLRNQAPKAALPLEERVARIAQNVRLHKAFLGILKDTSAPTKYVQIRPDGSGYDIKMGSPDNSIINKLLLEELFHTNILGYLDVSPHSKNGIKNASIDKKNGQKFDLKLVHHVERVGRRKTVPLSDYEKKSRKDKQRAPETSVRNNREYTRPRGDQVFLKKNRVPRPNRRDRGHPTGLGGTEGKSYTHNVMLGRWNNDGLGQLLGGLTSIAARFLHTKMCGPGSEGYDKLFENLLSKIEIQLDTGDENDSYRVRAIFKKETGDDPETKKRNDDLYDKLHEICGYFRDGPQASAETQARVNLQAAAVTLAKWKAHETYKELRQYSVLEELPELDEIDDAMDKAVRLIAVSDDDRFHNRTFLRHKDFPKHDLHAVEELGENGACVESMAMAGTYEIRFDIKFRDGQMPDWDKEAVEKEIREALLTEVGWFGAPPSTFAEKRAAKLLVYQRKLQAKYWIPVGSYTYCKKLAEKNKMCYLPYDSGKLTFEHICREFPAGNGNSACDKVTDAAPTDVDNNNFTALMNAI